MAHHSTVYLSLGSNLGDRAGNIKRALALIGEFGTDIVTSAYYATEPFGVSVPQPQFINIAAKLRTTLDVNDLAERLRQAEQHIGRLRKASNLARVIDIDMLCFNDLVVDSERLKLPHPQIFDRLFVLQPLCEIAPDLAIPPRGDKVRALLDKLAATDHSAIKRLTEAEIYA